MAKKVKKSNQAEDILASFASVAIGGVNGIAPLQDKEGGHFQVYISNDKVFIDVNVNAGFEYNVPDIAYEIQTRIKKEIERRTKYTVEKVNVNVVGVIMPL
ncbi:MAG: Asp23/Gls24 family envelope stress response protein [Clostridiales bacterium]|jgi:uncharacterized alkaline shock family protein YloU|nr:Asp23/Gls24 family envelope stress response protein [Clostridiales bacterium]